MYSQSIVQVCNTLLLTTGTVLHSPSFKLLPLICTLACLVPDDLGFTLGVAVHVSVTHRVPAKPTKQLEEKPLCWIPSPATPSSVT